MVLREKNKQWLQLAKCNLQGWIFVVIGWNLTKLQKPNFLDNPDACYYGCDCNIYGSLNDGKCSDGKCLCKENVEGVKCDKCKPGFIAPHRNRPATRMGSLHRNSTVCFKPGKPLIFKALNWSLN